MTNQRAFLGTPVVTDAFPGVEQFFEPGREILVAHTTDDALAALELSDAELARIGTAGRERVKGITWDVVVDALLGAQ